MHPHCSTCACAASGLSELSHTTGQRNAIDIAVVDGRIREMELAVAGLKRRRNTMLIINRLPEELLLEIFMCRLDYLRTRSCQRSSKSWLTTSHVSHHWRTLALSTPLLWNFADLRYQALATNMLNRAGSLPIYICLSEEEEIARAEDRFYSFSGGVEPSRPLDELPDSLVALVESHPCYVIDVCGGSTELDEVLVLACTNSTSEITSMTIVYQASDDEDAPQVYTITSSVASKTFPKLAYASFRNCVIDWNSSLFCASAAIRRLDISAYDELDWPDDVPPLLASNIVSALRNLPMLEELRIHRSIAILHDVPTAVAPTAELLMLPKLRVLSVHDFAGHVFSLLRRLRIHNSCALAIQCLTTEDPANEDYRVAIVEWIFKSPDRPPPSVESLTVSFSAYTAEINVYTGVEQLPSPFGEHEPHWIWKMTTTVPIRREETVRLLAAISALKPSILRVRSMGYVDRLAWHALGRMSARKVVFAEDHFISARSAFSDMLVESPGFLEQLEEVALEYKFISHSASDNWDTITAAFVHRVAGGTFKVLRLKINSVTAASQELVDRWAGFIPEVYLNGHLHLAPA